MSDIAHLLPCAEPVRFLAPDGTPAEPTAETAATMEDRGYTMPGDEDLLAVTRESFGDDEDDVEHNDEVGLVIPGSIAFIGMSFIACTLLLAGLPPLGGLNATPVEKLAKLFSSPGPVYEPEGRGRDWWRTARGLFAGGFRAGLVPGRAG